MKPPLTDRSLPLPAISTMYVEGVSRHPTEIREPEKLPLKYSDTMDRLNFLSERNHIHYHPYCLYSAGHARTKNLDLAREKESAIFNRDKSKVFLMTDSGGFQVKDNVGKFKGCNWNDRSDVNRRRLEILRWIEAVDPDCSMNLDIPSSTAMKAGKNPYFNNFKQCIDWTVDNWNYWRANQQRDINWINCLHGNGIAEAEAWYDAVRDYPTKKENPKGWAIAGFIGRNLHDTLYMLLRLREDGKLDGVEYIHFLGKFQAHIAVYLSFLQATLRETHPDIIVTFDAASPFIVAKNRNMILGAGPNGDFTMRRFYPNKTAKMLVATGIPIVDAIEQPKASPYFEGITLGDIHGKKDKQLDKLSYCIIMAHNVFKNLEAFGEAENYIKLIFGHLKLYHYYPELFKAIGFTGDVWVEKDGFATLAKWKHRLPNIFGKNDKYEERA